MRDNQTYAIDQIIDVGEVELLRAIPLNPQRGPRQGALDEHLAHARLMQRVRRGPKDG